MAEQALYPSFAAVVRLIDRERIGTVRDEGLLDSALQRPTTTVMGAGAYPSLELKAAALMHSVCLNHALMDGNKRLAAMLAAILLRMNGLELTLTNDEFFDLTMAVADGTLRDVDDIAARLVTVPRAT